MPPGLPAWPPAKGEKNSKIMQIDNHPIKIFGEEVRLVLSRYFEYFPLQVYVLSTLFFNSL